MPEYKQIFKKYEYLLEQNNDATNGGLETPVLSSTGNVVELTLTDEQFIEFLSAIEQGSELLYPEKQHEMTDLFTQGLQ